MSHGDPTSFVDIHSHLVPGVDDGAADVPAVLDSVERLTRQSIRRILTTPHIRGSLTLDREGLERRLSEVSAAWERATEAIGEDFPEVEFRRGHEVLLDVPNVDLSDPRIRMAGTSFVLVEWPRLHLPPGTVPVLKRLRDEGFRPIVAHPERYSGMSDALDVAARWREVGAYLQVNYGALVGRYGSTAQSTAYRLLRRGWVDYLASDFHGHLGLKIYKTEACAALEELGAGELITYLTKTNPARVLSDEEPTPVPTLPPDHRFWERIKRMIARSPT
ncbi:MAG TPA: CpsB/CapC family capsule biosynthesis tyrosine phosphatase [Longimicrobiales bacterium]|nr:CpsB/CapC family capsule biosynthesis tyrosine phosphatase [Longimicrobiales bacterium]